MDDYKEEYLKLMSMYAILLAQSVEDPIVSDVEYAYDAADGPTANETSGGFPGHAEMRDGRGGAGGGGEREVAICNMVFIYKGANSSYKL